MITVPIIVSPDASYPVGSTNRTRADACFEWEAQRQRSPIPKQFQEDGGTGSGLLFPQFNVLTKNTKLIFRGVLS